MAGARNSQEAVQQLIQTDPRFQQVMNAVKQSGGDAKSLFYAMAQQKGIDPNAVLSQAKSMLG